MAGANRDTETIVQFLIVGGNFRIMRQLAFIFTIGSLLNLFACSGQAKKTTDPTTDEIRKSIEDFNNRPIYKTLTSEILSQVKDEELEQVIMDNIFAKMDERMTNERKIVESLTPGQRAIYVTTMVEGEVDNGGFNQFYYNSTGELADMMEEAFKTIGANPFADLTRQANVVFSVIKTELEKYKDGTTESFSKSYDDNPLNSLDDKFYALEKEQSLSKIRIKYIRNNIKEFVND